MATTKVAVSLDSNLLQQLDRLVAERVFPNRSQAVQEAIRDKLERLARSRLARECAKLDLRSERKLADENLAKDAEGMAGILRGEIVWADLDPTRGHEQGGQRPVLVISHDVFNERSGTVIAMAITSQPQRGGISSQPRADERESAETIVGENQSDPDSFHAAAWREGGSDLDRGARASGRRPERNRRVLNGISFVIVQLVVQIPFKSSRPGCEYKRRRSSR